MNNENTTNMAKSDSHFANVNGTQGKQQQTTKYCVNCKHYVDRIAFSLHFCKHPKHLNVITGKPQLCAIVRNQGCGQMGVYFDAKNK